jgi:transcriptional regulator with XRE-family HTH domain
VENELLNCFGERVRSLRRVNGLSQEALADKTGFHRTYIGMIERGERNLSLLNTNKFARAFGMSISELLNFQDARNRTSV